MRSNTLIHYGSVTKGFHWLTAALIFAVIPLGIIANGLPYETSEEIARKAFLFSLHKTVGVAIFFVALARILWAIRQPKPRLLNADKPFAAFLAQTAHWLLYGSLVLVPLSGWIHHAATTGFAPIWWPFGQSLPFVPKSLAVAEAAAGLHIVFERVLVVSLALHIAGAVKHHVWDRDATLKRMLPGRLDLPALSGGAERSESRKPFAAAIGVWAIALSIGAALGVYGHTSDTESGAVQAVASEWSVDEATIGLTITQLGSEVRGSFESVATAISFDPDVRDGTAGAVEVDVAIGSLTLGSVRDQAMGPDFFDLERFPTARVVGDIIAREDGYSLEGSLTIKDMSQPLSLPFSLELADGIAEAEGRLILDRRDFAVGLGQSDAGTLGFEVVIDIAVTARAP